MWLAPDPGHHKHINLLETARRSAILSLSTTKSNIYSSQSNGVGEWEKKPPKPQVSQLKITTEKHSSDAPGDFPGSHSTDLRSTRLLPLGDTPSTQLAHPAKASLKENRLFPTFAIKCHRLHTVGRSRPGRGRRLLGQRARELFRKVDLGFRVWGF